ncbi:MAG: chromosomal replication initiator protein DnaA, partial [Prevotella sp.]|nr:chromosomal replication initiator protein DnaA [Prevotella sp.]
MKEDSPKDLWDQALMLIRNNLDEKAYNTWFKPIVFESYDEQKTTLLVQVSSGFVYEYLEANYVDLMSKALKKFFGEGIRLTYRIVTDKEHNLTQNIEADPADAIHP